MKAQGVIETLLGNVYSCLITGLVVYSLNCMYLPDYVGIILSEQCTEKLQNPFNPSPAWGYRYIPL